jgi:hypothetical protein
MIVDDRWGEFLTFARFVQRRFEHQRDRQAEALSRTGRFYSAIIGQFYPGVDKRRDYGYEVH